MHENKLRDGHWSNVGLPLTIFLQLQTTSHEVFETVHISHPPSLFEKLKSDAYTTATTAAAATATTTRLLNKRRTTI